MVDPPATASKSTGSAAGLSMRRGPLVVADPLPARGDDEATSGPEPLVALATSSGPAA